MKRYYKDGVLLRELPDDTPPMAFPENRFHVLWRKLHTYAPASAEPLAAWMTAFTAEVPCGECRRHWSGLLQATPPPVEGYFAWTVDAHNQVNAKLGKPQLTQEEARALYPLASAAAASPPM